jgi:hypothetical protein
VSDDIGLPEPARREIAATLAGYLAGIPDGVQAVDALRAIEHLCNDVGTAHGWPGVFELAAAAINVATRDIVPTPSTVYIGYGRDTVDANPQTPVEYAIGRFGTHILHGRRADAWAEFAALQAERHRGAEPTDAMAEFLVKVLRNAWGRQAGSPVQLELTATRWPPVCDFCCGPPALWMYYVTGADLEVGDGRTTMGPIAVRIDDFEYWYACRACRKLIDAHPPRWAEIFARHRMHRPHARRERVQPMYDAFYRFRKQKKPVPLPEKRPAPTPGRI